MVPDTGRMIITLPIQDFYLDDIAAHLKVNPAAWTGRFK